MLCIALAVEVKLFGSAMEAVGQTLSFSIINILGPERATTAGVDHLPISSCSSRSNCSTNSSSSGRDNSDYSSSSDDMLELDSRAESGNRTAIVLYL